MSTALIQILASFLAALFSFFGISSGLPGFSDSDDINISIEYHNSVPGNADALITVEAAKDGEFSFFWADNEFNKITYSTAYGELEYSEFAKITTAFGSGSYDLPDFTAIPEGAEHILVMNDGDVIEIFAVPDEKTVSRGDRIYSYGVISDLHFNRYDSENGGDYAEFTFRNSLEFFDRAGVSLVAMPGDISTDGEKEAFMLFNTISSEFSFPVLTTTGNHDLHSKYKKENWLTYMNPEAYQDNRAPEVINVADNGIDFAYTEPTTGDIFIFLNQTSNNYGLLFNALLADSQLDWLEARLEEYKDETVYLFFHTFLTSDTGNPFDGTGNLQNELGWSYPLFYTTGATDEVRFRNLLKEYDNVVFFSGHSHWAYHMQYMNPQLNISRNGGDGAVLVHVSSVSSPRITEDYQVLWSGTDPDMSEGYLVEVYEDTIILYGVDFINNRILAYAVYECGR